MGLFNAWTLKRYKNNLVEAYGNDVGRWYILLLATQFHVIFYASRTLPNMFAFGLSELSISSERIVLKPFSYIGIGELPSLIKAAGCSQSN